MMVSRVQRQEHHNLATIQRAKLKRAHECSKGLRFVKTLNPNAKPNKDGQSSQWGLLPNDNNERKYESDETNTFIVSFFPSLNSRAPLYTSTFPLAFSIAFLMYILKEKKKRKWKTLLMYTVYIDVSNYTLLALTLVHMWYEESTPGRNLPLTCYYFQYFGVSLFELISYKKQHCHLDMATI